MPRSSKALARLEVVSSAVATTRERRWQVPGADELTQVVGEPELPHLSPEAVRVLVWNVFKGKRRTWAPQFRRLVGDRDLVLAQELYFEDRTRALFDEFEFQWATATSFNYARRGGVGTGLGTAARAESLRVRALQTAGREPVTRTPKLALLTEHRLGADDTLLVVNVHAINFAGFRSFDAQLGRIEDALADHPGPTLLAGDFNTWTPRRRRRLVALMRAGKLDAVEFEGDPRTNPLDHAFVRGLEVREAQVHTSRASDHAALSFELSAC